MIGWRFDVGQGDALCNTWKTRDKVSCSTSLKRSFRRSLINSSAAGGSTCFAARLESHADRTTRKAFRSGLRTPAQRTLLDGLESLFGQYKRLEGQHSKGGFTGLIAALPMLLTHWTPEKVRESLTTVPVKAMKQWLRDNLATTLTSKRATAYREFAKSSG